MLKLSLPLLLGLLFCACAQPTAEQYATRHQKGLVVVYFWGKGCRSCGIQDREFAKFRQNATVAIEKIEPDQATIRKYSLTHFPTILFFKDGREVRRATGILYEDQLRAAVAELGQ